MYTRSIEAQAEAQETIRELAGLDIAADQVGGPTEETLRLRARRHIRFALKPQGLGSEQGVSGCCTIWLLFMRAQLRCSRSCWLRNQWTAFDIVHLDRSAKPCLPGPCVSLTALLTMGSWDCPEAETRPPYSARACAVEPRATCSQAGKAEHSLSRHAAAALPGLTSILCVRSGTPCNMLSGRQGRAQPVTACSCCFAWLDNYSVCVAAGVA